MVVDVEKRRKRQLRVAEGYLSLGMPDHAIDALKQVSDPGESAFECHLLRGNALRAKLDHHEALESFRRAHLLNPGSLEVLLGMAWCFKRIDRVDQSIESMRRAYQMHPTVPIVLYNLACYHSLAGHKEQALSWLGRALRMDRSFGRLVSAETDFDPLRDDRDFQRLLELSAEE
jgi:tetratricopeptide (TPR) repeat protein